MDDHRETGQRRDSLEHGGETRRGPSFASPTRSGMHEQQAVASGPAMMAQLASRLVHERWRHANRRAKRMIAAALARALHEVLPDQAPRDHRPGHYGSPRAP